MNFKDCMGCHRYSSSQGGCQVESCWMEAAYPNGKGAGRRYSKVNHEDYQWCGTLRKKKERGIMDRNKEKFLSMYQEGYSDKAIGIEFGCSYQTVFHFRKKLGLPAIRSYRLGTADG